jgi:hypothetical protein
MLPPPQFLAATRNHQEVARSGHFLSTDSRNARPSQRAQFKVHRVVTRIEKLCSFSWLRNIPQRRDLTLFTRSPADGHLASFYLSATVSSDAENLCSVKGYTPRQEWQSLTVTVTPAF